MSRAKAINKNLHLLPPIDIPKEFRQKTIPISREEIDNFEKSKNEKIIFSFRLLELTHRYFNLGGTCIKWFNNVFAKLQDISSITKNELLFEKKDIFRPHPIKWEDVDQKFPFSGLEQLECRQISFGKGLGRMHGIMIGNVFYIVWLDPHHNLYPCQQYGGRKEYKPGETCCGFLDDELKRLERENRELIALLEEYTTPDEERKKEGA